MESQMPSRGPHPGTPTQAPEARIRKTPVALAAVTLVFACAAATYLEFMTRSAHMAMANLPLAVLLPFVFWLLGNAVMKRVAPR